MRVVLGALISLVSATAFAQAGAETTKVLVKTKEGVNISCAVTGNGPRTVMFVHGWLNSSLGFAEVVKNVDPAGLRLVSCDLRGTGDSDKPEGGYTIEQFAKDTMAVADHLKAKKVTLVGFSMGGPISEWAAIKWPGKVAGLVLVNPSPASGVPLPPEAIDLFRNSVGNSEKHKTIYAAGGSKNIPPETLKALLEDAAKVPAPALQGGFDAFTKANFIDKLSSIKVPTLVIGSDDLFYNQDTLHKTVVEKIPGSRLVYLPGAGHWTIAERPREVAALISAYLAASK